MNVSNVTMPVGASGTVTATAGTSAGTEFGGLGDLFSMQMGQALQSMLPGEEQASAPAGLGEDDMKALEELMELLQQLLSAGQNPPQELVHHLEEKAGAIDQLSQKVQGDGQPLTDNWKELLAKLANSEPATDEMEKLAALLESLKNQKTNQDTKRSPLAARTDAMMQLKSTQQDSLQNIQPLRLNQGLSAYKTEAGIPSQAVQSALQTAGAASQESAEGDNSALLNVQSPVTSANQLQNSSTFQQVAAQTHAVHANQLTEQVSQIFVKQMKLTEVNGVHEAKLILYPQSLGQVDVTITSHNGVITARFAAETQAGKEMLDNQLPQLRAALTQQGLQVDRLEVNQQQTSAFDFQQQREQTRQQQENRRQDNKQSDDQEEFALDALVDNNESTASLWNRLRETTRGINDIV